MPRWAGFNIMVEDYYFFFFDVLYVLLERNVLFWWFDSLSIDLSFFKPQKPPKKIESFQFLEKSDSIRAQKVINETRLQP